MRISETFLNCEERKILFDCSKSNSDFFNTQFPKKIIALRENLLKLGKQTDKSFG